MVKQESFDLGLEHLQRSKADNVLNQSIPDPSYTVQNDKNSHSGTYTSSITVVCLV